MHVGMGAIFQGFGGTLSDHEVLQADVALADLAEPLGYQSIWGVEHHFTSYAMCPDILQFLTYMAGRTETVKLGSMVAVLPWHDPLRLAEQIVVLDHLSGGRLIVGLGRGTGKVEFDGFRTEMGTARQQFKEAAEAILGALGRSSSSRAWCSDLHRWPPFGVACTRPPSRPSRLRSWPSWALAS
jgi:alkanesulfonate monooxygenase SsuD/methylene tetrahydromethanopterin reductase-like flavin-dependent oxidoreductase (luciferase family)